MKLMEKYTDETGNGAMTLYCHVHAPTIEYVAWLENKINGNTNSNLPGIDDVIHNCGGMVLDEMPIDLAYNLGVKKAYDFMVNWRKK